MDSRESTSKPGAKSLKDLCTSYLLPSLALTLAMLLVAVSPRAGAASEIGIAPERTSAFEFLGQSKQDNQTVRHYGYLTHITGVADDLLYSDPSIRTEATARFTFSGTTTIDERNVHGNIISTAAPGILTLYFNETPTGDFSSPESFASGVPIATFEMRYHNVLTVQTPDVGSASAIADLEQSSSTPFTLAGEQYRFGHPNLRERAWATGQGTRTQPSPPESVFLLGGTVVITGD